MPGKIACLWVAVCKFFKREGILSHPTPKTKRVIFFGGVGEREDFFVTADLIRGRHKSAIPANRRAAFLMWVYQK